MPYETDLDTAFTILLGKAIGVGTPTPIPTPAPTPTPTTTARAVDVGFVFGTLGTPVAVGDHSFIRLGLNAPVTVVSWSLAGTVGGASSSGSVAVGVEAGSTMLLLTSICGGDEPELTSDYELTEQAPTGAWTTLLHDPTWLRAEVQTTGGTLEVVSLTLRLLVNS